MSELRSFIDERPGNDCYITTEWFLLDSAGGEFLVKVEHVSGWCKSLERTIHSPYEDEETIQAYKALKEQNAY
jgi:hypothetical protein